MRALLVWSLLLFLSAPPAWADIDMIVFPPKLTDEMSDCTIGKTMILAWQSGRPVTYCLSGKDVLSSGIYSHDVCGAGNYLSFDGTHYICNEIPACPANQFLNFANGNFFCAPLVMPTCPDNQLLTTDDGLIFKCFTPAAKAK